MAAKRKSRAGGHRKHYRRATNRTRTHYARHTRRKSIFTRSRNRRHNPSVHRRHYMRHRRRRNPAGVSGKEVLYFAGAGMALAIVQPIVGNVIGNVAGNLLGNFTSPAITALTGWGLGKLAGMTHATRDFERPLMILGLSTAVIQIVQPYVSNLIGGATKALPAPATMSGPWPHSYSNWNKWNPGLGRHRRHMRGIGVVTAVPPMIVAPAPVAAPPAAAAATNGTASSTPTGMQGLGMRPGVWAH